MPDDNYQPVCIAPAQTLAQARLRPGFTPAWDVLEEEYAALKALLSARKTRIRSNSLGGRWVSALGWRQAPVSAEF